jgi:hypothetical protein
MDQVLQPTLHPHVWIIHVLIIGRVAELMAPPREVRLRALPLLRINHCGTSVLLLKLIEPCPKSLMDKKPASNVTGVFT